ncbi:MAG TPA: Ig-like domain-containing protein, partial [Gemmatimonadaceae bacterium]
MKRGQRGRGSGSGRSFVAFFRRGRAARPRALGQLAALFAAVIVLGTTCTDSTGPGDPPTPTTMLAVSATAQEAVAGSAVPDAPAVIIRDQNGTAMAGISVAFTVSLGGGTVSPSSVVTGGDGVARVASWTLGGTPGNNTLVAAVAGLTAVSFTANGLQPPPVATTVEAASALTQQAQVGAAVAEPPAVLVRDQNGQAMANVAVAFAVTAGSGVIEPTTVTTGSDGIARVTSWTLGPSAGANTATATVTGLGPVTFAATAVAAQVPVATSVEAVGALSQSALAGTAVSDPPGVLVRDQNNAPMAGVLVAFAVTGGGGVIAPAEQVTGADGIARAVSWELGPVPGVNGATATVMGFAPVAFTAQGVAPPSAAPAKIEAVTSTVQDGSPGAPVSAPPTVRVLDANDQPLSGVIVAFAVTAGGGSIAPASQITGTNGLAQLTSWTLGPGVGLNTVTATVSGLAPVQFNANAIAAPLVPTTITAVTPASQQAPVGTAVGTPPAVIVRDQFGAPLPGVAVAFTVTIGGGSAVPGSVVTGANGIAALTSWTVGQAPGGNSVIATVGTLPAVVFNATGFVPAAPASLSAESPVTQQAPAGGTVQELPTVLVRDQNQNPLPGVTVSFAVSGGGGSVSPATVVTGPLGTARLTTWTLATTPGSNAVTATVTGLTPVTFTATGILVPGAVEPITATSQTAPVGTSVTQPPGVLVRDQFGAPLAGAQVVFAITAGGGSATPLATATLADGTARLSTWTLGPNAGPNTITATVAGLPAVTFNAGGVQPAAVASSVEPVTVQVQEAAAGGLVAAPPGVRVRDQNNGPMAGVTVNFTVTSGGGSVIPSTVVTGSDGVAQLTSWTLGTSAGANTVAAAVTGLEPVSFSATARLVPIAIEATTPTAQQAPASSAVASPPGVIVRDQFGNPLAGVTVSFAVTAGGGTRSPATVTTGANGVAQLSSWTLGSAAGANTLTATASGLAQTVTFNATGILVASSVQATTALMQEAAAGAAVSQPPGVMVRDHLNNPMQGVTVTFAVTAGGGSINPSSVVTGVDGIATLTSWTLGAAGGSNSVIATVTGLTPVTFNAVGNLVSASIEATTATSQQAPAGSAVPQPPGVIVRDQFGAPRPGVTVTFAVTAGGGSITPSSVVTGSNGIAQLTNWTLGAGAGTNTVTATATGLPPVTFNATAIVPGPPTSVQAVTAISQEAPAGSPVLQPPGVIVRDANSLPVPGVTVAFAVTSGGGSVSPASVVTGGDGIAQLTSWTLGNAQTQTVAATVGALPPVIFTATRSATALVATTIQATTALNQEALAGAAVPESPGVVVRDQFGDPLPGVTVSFAVTAGGGTRSPATVTTGANGVAQLSSWTLGSAAGAN